jgi:DNA-binding transcriptional regulator YhcF (GntR family)
MAQLELKILSGALKHGQRLPSVRSLARRLQVHHNTVSAAYQDLEAAGHVELRRGAGVFVSHEGPSALSEARGLDEMIRMALHGLARATWFRSRRGALARRLCLIGCGRVRRRCLTSFRGSRS